ncbi:Pentatricopeptide repeat [Melia azedarach]|uniref:Pentatricopeptide repeat n=1 Tax=Melia azedarach TaxID=155640 RepID=A0ACC1XT93_MELAZ|nr:Pentatricopeptide repeat [Melia azedarach]
MQCKISSTLASNMHRLSSKTWSLLTKHRSFSFSPRPNATYVQLPAVTNQFNSNLVCLKTNHENDNRTGSHNSRDEFSHDVEKIFRILKKFHSRIPKLELALQHSGVVLRPGLTERVINRCGDAGNLGYKYFMWASKQPNYVHSYDVYRALIKSLSKMRQFGAVWALIEEMRKEKPELITTEVFVVLMRRFASARMVKKAIEVLDMMPKYGCEPDEEGKLIEAKHVLVQMKEANIEPDIVVYNNLLSGYAQAGKMSDAFELLKEMRKKGCDPNANSYTVLIQALCGQEKMDEAMRVFVEMERSGCEADVVTYTALISGFCKWGKIDRGYDILDSMIRRGFVPNQLTFLHIMLAHEKQEELEKCVELMEEMKKIGCVPDMEGSGLSPGIDSFVVMIHGFLGQGCLIEACDYFKEMVGRGLLSAPQYGTLKELLNSLLRAQKLEMAKDVWSCIVTKGCELNVSAWTIWIHSLFSNGNVKEACSYCLDMMDADLMPQPDTFAKLMRGLKKLYNRQIAAEITEKVRKMAAQRQITFKMYKRRGERDLKEKAKAKTDGRKRRARQRQWRGGHGKAKIL